MEIFETSEGLSAYSEAEIVDDLALIEANFF
jgi:hypothetical protein